MTTQGDQHEWVGSWGAEYTLVSRPGLFKPTPKKADVKKPLSKATAKGFTRSPPNGH